jgi:hypothetical protein
VCSAKKIDYGMAEMGQSRRGRLLPVVGRLLLCPESGPKVRASASVALGQQQTHAVQQTKRPPRAAASHRSWGVDPSLADAGRESPGAASDGIEAISNINGHKEVSPPRRARGSLTYDVSDEALEDIFVSLVEGGSGGAGIVHAKGSARGSFEAAQSAAMARKRHVGVSCWN